MLSNNRDRFVGIHFALNGSLNLYDNRTLCDVLQELFWLN